MTSKWWRDLNAQPEPSSRALRHSPQCRGQRQANFSNDGVACTCGHHSYGTDTIVGGRSARDHTLNASDVVTVVSESLKKDTVTLFEVIREIDVIHNFICPSHFQRAPDDLFRKQLSPSGAPILCHISNFRPVKRVMDAVEVFARVRKQRQCTLLMVGDGPERAGAEAKCRSLGIADDVVFLGKVKNPIEPLLIADLLMLPSETESFGLVALEAMAAGVPVISSNVGGLPEVNVHGESGMLREVGDVVGMAEDALVMLADAHLSLFKSRARNRANAFTIDRILPQYLEVYRKALNAEES